MKKIIGFMVLVAFILSFGCGAGGTGETTEVIDVKKGTGVSLTQCRANWPSGYIQGEVVRQVLQAAGYTVSDPSLLELGPSNAYTKMAEGSCDFWANSWYPGHNSWYATALDDGSTVGDHVQAVDGLFYQAGVQGYLITKAWADSENIVSLDQINNTPALYEALDTDNDGIGEILGCPSFWTCDDIIDNHFAFAGYTNLVQTMNPSYDALFAEFKTRVQAGLPAVMYTFTPSSYIVELKPGIDVYWLSVEEGSILDGSNPLGKAGGEMHTQQGGHTDVDPTMCTQPCQLGWVAASIQVTARKEILTANPHLKRLLELIKPSILDISTLQVAQTAGDSSQAHVIELATSWMTDNAVLVQSWLEAAAVE